MLSFLSFLYLIGFIVGVVTYRWIRLTHPFSKLMFWYWRWRFERKQVKLSGRIGHVRYHRKL